MSEPGGERFVPLLGVYLNETKIERRFQEGLFVVGAESLICKYTPDPDSPCV